MKHNNLKKPAAVLTALALAAALLAGPLKAQTREMQTKWPQRNVQT